MRVEERTKYTDGKLMDPNMESKGLGDSQLKEGPLEMMLGMIRSNECIQQLVASEAIIAAIVSQGIDSIKSPYQSDDEHVKVRALGSRGKLGASGGSDATPRPFAEGRSTKRAEGYRRFLINPNRESDMRRGAVEGCPTSPGQPTGRRSWGVASRL